VPGSVVVLNGMPRSGKTSIARALQAATERVWVNIGNDQHVRTLPDWLSPGAGLRPFAVAHASSEQERERLLRIEAHVPGLYAAMYASAAAHAHRNFDVVMDVGHHVAYSRKITVWADCARELDGLSYLLVGVECPLDVIWERREATWGQKREEVDQGVLAAVERGQAQIHVGLDYDLIVDTSEMTPDECAAAILAASNRRGDSVE
jgi:chloramphenicol 3-O phosphotransferase